MTQTTEVKQGKGGGVLPYGELEQLLQGSYIEASGDQIQLVKSAAQVPGDALKDFAAGWHLLRGQVSAFELEDDAERKILSVSWRHPTIWQRWPPSATALCPA